MSGRAPLTRRFLPAAGLLILAACGIAASAPAGNERSAWSAPDAEAEREAVRFLLHSHHAGEALRLADSLLSVESLHAAPQEATWTALRDHVEALHAARAVPGSSGSQSCNKEWPWRPVTASPEGSPVAAGARWAALTEVLHWQGELEAAELACRRSLEIRDRVLGSTHPDTIEGRRRLSDLIRNRVHFETKQEAVRIAERAVADAATLGADHPLLADCLSTLAHARRAVGEIQAAIGLYRRALAIDERIHGSNAPATCASLVSLGYVLRGVGRHSEALLLLERSRDILEANLGPEHPALISTLEVLRWILIDLGDVEQALSLRERDRRIRETVYGADHRMVTGALETHAQDEPAIALSFAKRRAEIAEAWGKLVQLRGALRDWASALVALGRHEEALPIIDRAVELQQTVMGRPALPELLSLRARILAGLGETGAARVHVQRAIDVATDALGDQHPQLVNHLELQSHLRATAGDREAALDAAIQAHRLQVRHLRLTARALTERQLYVHAEQLEGSRALLASLTLGKEQGDRQVFAAWDALSRSRAVVLDALASRHRLIVGTDDAEIRALAKSLEESRGRLTRLLRKPLSSVTPARVHAARDELENLDRQLAAASASYAERGLRESSGLAEIVQELPPGAALLSFVRHGVIESERERACGSSPNCAAAYTALAWLPDDEDPIVIALGDAARIDTLIRKWGLEVARGRFVRGRSASDAEAACRDAGLALRRAVWDPLAPRLATERMLFIVPDGALHAVNFGALPTDHGRYLVEVGPLLHLLSAERDLVRTDDGPTEGRGLLALGAPTFDRHPTQPTIARERGAGRPVFRGPTSSSAEFRDLVFAPLPGSRREVEELARWWSRARPDEPGLLLTGPAANEAAFKAAAGGRRVIHLATHGFLLGAGAETEARSEEPLLLAGLALAGANLRGSTSGDAEDGVLTAEEVGAMDLLGTELVVVSACHGGAGPTRVGEGVLGLRRAFEVAGAGALVSSLWAVEDEATRTWMRTFHEARFERGFRLAESVREASRGVLRERRARGESTHPSTWAAFVASGDWR